MLYDYSDGNGDIILTVWMNNGQSDEHIIHSGEVNNGAFWYEEMYFVVKIGASKMMYARKNLKRISMLNK